MTITTRQELADFCLRQLGGGVVNIEVTPEQLEDAIDVAIEWYNEFHYDGIERDYIVTQVQPSVLTVADSTGWAIGETLTGATSGAKATITALTPTKVTIGPIDGLTKFGAENVSNGTTTIAVTSVALGEFDSGFFTMPDHVVSVLRVMNFSTAFYSSEMLFNPQYQIMQQEIQNLTSSGGASHYYGVMQYIAHLDFILRKEKDFRFNRRWGKVYLDVIWGTDAKIGDLVAFEVYKALDDTSYPKLLNDRWLKEYTTALIKKQWGQNLSKYDGMTLPGGLNYNGKYILEQAKEEIAEIEAEAINSSAPLFFAVG